jgi:hypothetical protein
MSTAGRCASAEGSTSHISTTSTGCPADLRLIMTIVPLPDAMKPGFQGVRTHCIRGFMAFQPDGRTPVAMLMVPV